MMAEFSFLSELLL